MSIGLDVSTLTYPWMQSLARWEPEVWESLIDIALRWASSLLPHTMACLSPPVRVLYSIATHARLDAGFSLGRITFPV